MGHIHDQALTHSKCVSTKPNRRDTARDAPSLLPSVIIRRAHEQLQCVKNPDIKSNLKLLQYTTNPNSDTNKS